MGTRSTCLSEYVNASWRNIPAPTANNPKADDRQKRPEYFAAVLARLKNRDSEAALDGPVDAKVRADWKVGCKKFAAQLT